ncbi:MAG: phage tail tape measure protein [Desulfobacteraceae bacterium]|nr:phage tail tape measure protein [Desulfobacteraceae bacterium]
MESIFKLGILLSVIDRVSGPSASIGRGMTGLRGKVMSLGPAFDKFKTYGLIVTTVAAGLLSVMSGTVMATVATQKALGEVSSVGIENLQALESAATEFSGKWAGTTKAQFIAASYDIKSGISSLTDEGVAKFTRLSALTGKATKSTTAAMTKLFALGHGIFSQDFINDDAFGNQFSAAISSAVKRFRTDGDDLAQGMFSIGANAKAMGVSLAEELSIIGTAKSAFNSASEAGTAYNAFLAGAVKAQKSLGLTFTDTNGDLLPMVEILGLLKAKYGDLNAAEIGEISKGFGSQEATKIITALIPKTTQLKASIEGLNADMAQGTNFTEQMAMAMNKDIGSGIALLSQRFSNLVEVIGNQLTPILIPLFTWIGNIINWIIKFAGEHKILTKILVVGISVFAVVVFVLGVLAAVLGAVGLLVPQVTVGFSMVGKAALFMKTGLLSAVASTKSWILWQRQALLTSLYFHGGVMGLARSLATSFLSAIGAAITAVWSFTVALLANPLTWIVVGVIALGAALYFLYQKFDIVKKGVDTVLYGLGYLLGVAIKFGRGLWEAITHPMEFISFLFHAGGEAIAGLIGWFKSLVPAIKSTAKLLLSIMFPPLAIAFNWDAIKNGVKKMVGWIKGIIPSFFTSISRVGGSAIKGLIGWFKSLAPAIKSTAKLLLTIMFPPLAIAFNWDVIKNGVKKMVAWIKGMIPNFLASGKALWGAFTGGLKSMIMAPVNFVKSGLSKIRNLLPFSDAKEGPLSTLTLSGVRMMETIAAGVQSAAPGLVKGVSAAMAGVAAVSVIGGGIQAPPGPILQNLSLNPPQLKQIAAKKDIIPTIKSMGKKDTIPTIKPMAKQKIIPTPKPGDKKVFNITINGLTLPNVSDADSLLAQLQRLAEGYDND